MSVSEPSTPGLVIEGVSVDRSGARIVSDVSLLAPPGRITLLLGANGAGKTTLLESISGIVPVATGTVSLNGRQLQRLSRPRRVRHGLAHVEQGRAVFPDLTVDENLRVAGARSDAGEVYALFPELTRRAKTRAGMLSGGEQQMLVIARSVILRPRILMLDEMSLGLAPMIVKRLVPVIRRLVQDGMGVLLVEQFAALALSIGDRAYVLSNGRVVHEGACEQLKAEHLRDVYLGSSNKERRVDNQPSEER